MSTITKADYDELVRLRDAGFVYMPDCSKGNEHTNIADAIAEYEREHKEDV